MKKILFVLFVLAGISVGLLFLFSQMLQAPSKVPLPKKFIILNGETTASIGKKLEKEGLIKSYIAFRIYLEITGQSRSIPSGEFYFTKSLNVPSLIDFLQQGPTEIWVTIPEGLRREEVAERFIKSFELEGEARQSFYNEFLISSKNDEGRLFPNTYLFPKDVKAQDVILTMKSLFESQVDFPVSKEQLILASIIERETITQAERPVVAGILLKRLSAHWALNADATIQYLVGTNKCKAQVFNCKWWEPVTPSDLQINSPYNSYKFPGLPPTAIANPGFSSIKAATNPEETSYWYYLHDGNGQIHYAETLEQHNANVAKYLQ